MGHRRLIIPIFIPFGGCAHQCVFCDQKGITGKAALPGLDEVRQTIEKYLSTWKGKGEKEAAFYGGSFTGLPLDIQNGYLECAGAFVESGKLDSLRLSTRPDYISVEIAAFLRERHVETVELGAQSMVDEVLKASGRGHTAEQTAQAVRVLKDSGMKTGLQLMPGLPGDTFDSVMLTMEEAVKLAPDFVRLYPSLVLKDTPLHRMYLEGSYKPWALDDMVEACAAAKKLFDKAGIPIIRMGLQTTDELVESIVAGPFHPSFRQLVEAAVERLEQQGKGI
ncbi:MAG: radical SAM protein [Deltaproteobacteria bacterium]|nr:radical SAM protein [Deltaproteobacteria bacterium]